MEDKQKILDLLLPTLQATRNLHDLADLRYYIEHEIVVVTFSNGYRKTVNVAMDSGTAMISDVLKNIV